MSVALRLADVRRSFDRRIVLSGVQLDVHFGEVLGLVGANGSGKSTLLRTLTGIDDAQGGTVEHMDDGDRGSVRIGALLDPAWLDERLTCRQHVAVALLSTSGRVGRGSVSSALAIVGLAGAENRRVKHLSLGMRQRLALAVALVDEPNVLVLDEPLNGLDPDGVRWMRGLLSDFTRSGGAVLLSSHLLAELEQVADRVVLLHQGTITALDRGGSGDDTVVRARPATGAERLVPALVARGATVDDVEGTLAIRGVSPADVFRTAVMCGTVLVELVEDARPLEARYRDAVATSRG